MSTILYSTRAGDPAFRNQDRVVALARERDAEFVERYRPEGDNH